MKKILLCLLSLCAWSAETLQFDPMLEFSSGNYLGLGRYTARDGRTEFYSSIGIFSSNEWVLAYNSGIGTSFYNLFFEFDENKSGYFDLVMMRETPGPGSGFYAGHGFCGSHQCLLYATLDDNFLEETITFHPNDNKIYRLGSLHARDENGIMNVTWWEESMNYIGQNQAEEILEEPLRHR